MSNKTDETMKQLYYKLLVLTLSLTTVLISKAQQVEYFWDTDPGVGNGEVIQTFVGNAATLQVNLDVSQLPEGIHQIGLRALNGEYCSATYYRSFYVPATAHRVEAIEYYFDVDPGIGNAIRRTATITGESQTLAFDVDTDELSEGVHHFGIRTLTDGTWSATKVRQFLVRSAVANHITYLEYYWDKDPGAGNGNKVNLTPNQEVTLDFEADLTELSEGMHSLVLRALSGLGGWSTTSLEINIEDNEIDDLQRYLDSLVDIEDEWTNGTYRREFHNDNWQALYVPFTVSSSDWSTNFDVARISGLSKKGDSQVLEATVIESGNLQTNYPYLIRAKSKSGATLTVNVSSSAQTANSVDFSGVTITGNYSQLTGLKSAHRYRMQGGTLSIPGSDSEVLLPYRWYMTIEGSAARELRLCINGEEFTGIENVNDSQPRPLVYTLSGRRVNVDAKSLRKGIYLINNKKCVVK